jgi:type IV secretory pathway VirJ component
MLADNDVPVVGFNTLRYFWTARTPEETARDVPRTMEHYMRTWSRERVVLLGYSIGADVMPYSIACPRSCAKQ